MLTLLLLLQAGLPDVGPSRIPKPGEGAKPKPPANVLIVVVDDIGVDQMGCYAQNYPTLAEQPCTPNLDQLALTSMRFTNAWANPVCSPSRAALQTGRLSRNTGIGTITGDPGMTQYTPGLQLDQPTLATLLPHYARVALGKWHISDQAFDRNGVHHPLELGYDEYAGSLYNLDDSYSSWTKTYYPAGVSFGGYPSYATVDTTQDALDRIASLPEPWILYVAYNGSHEPLHCPTAQGYLSSPNPPGVCGTDWCFDCETLVGSPAYAGYPDEVVQARAVTQAVDLEIGRLLSAVDYGDTALILASDNGSPKRTVVPPFRHDHSKGTIYQGGVNVPLFVRVPGGDIGECHELVSLTDVYATVADIAGVGAPPDRLRDSVSLLQYVRPKHAAPGSKPRDHVYTELFAPNFIPDANGEPPPGYEAALHHRAIRNGTHKLIEKRWWDPELKACRSLQELYRLADAPGQDPAFGPDPQEEVDLNLDPSSWDKATKDAYKELSNLLRVQYPTLPVQGCP